eukprot:SAG11_NODE_1211_length_5514_cov_40.185596_4_plen_61_part_00
MHVGISTDCIPSQNRSINEIRGRKSPRRQQEVRDVRYGVQDNGISSTSTTCAPGRKLENG